MRGARRVAVLRGHLPPAGGAAAATAAAGGEAADDGPLAGVLVVDMTQMVSGPMGTQLLADQGAEVVKVEGLRGAAERGGARSVMSSPLFAILGRNKKSVCVDLRTPEGRDIVLRLCATADCFVQNYRPGVAESMGFGYEALAALNPKLVYCSISGYGSTGPYSQQRVYDPIIQSVSGLASVQADEEGRPRMMRLIIPDKVTAVTSAQAITAALLRREKSGKGCHVRLSMLDAVVSFMWPEAMARHTFVPDAGQPPPPPHTYVRDMVYETADGRFITCGAVQDKEWVGLCKALGREEWVKDPRFATGEGRSLNREERFRLTAEAIRRMPAAEALRRLSEHDVPNGPVNHPRESVIDDPQVRNNGTVFTAENAHGVTRLMRQARPAARFADAAWELRRPAPLLGQDTMAVLGAVPGVTPDQLAALLRKGVISAGKRPKPRSELRKRDGRLNDPLSG